jgi:hypothetical protein
LDAGIRLGNDDVVVHVLAATFRRYKDGTPSLIDEIILPGIGYFTEKEDARWAISLGLSNISEKQIEPLLKNLLLQKQIDTHAEFVLAVLASKYPKRIFDFFVERLQSESTKSNAVARYQPVPYHFYKLQTRFTKISEHALDVARRHYRSDDRMFRYTFGRLTAAAFPTLTEPLKAKFLSFINERTREDLAFVIQVLSGYSGSQFVDDLCKEIVRRLDPNDRLQDDLSLMLQSTGVVSGEFGFVDAYKKKREQLMPWLSDPDANVRLFAQKHIAGLDRHISAEQRRSEEDLEMRKRQYDDPEGSDT